MFWTEIFLLLNNHNNKILNMRHSQRNGLKGKQIASKNTTCFFIMQNFDFDHSHTSAILY